MYYKNIAKSLLSFLWALPFLYIFFDNFFTLDFRISTFTLKVLLGLSCFSAFILFTIWFQEFRESSYLKNAFAYLKQHNIPALDRILNKTAIDNYLEEGKTLMAYGIDNQLPQDIISYLLTKEGWVVYTQDEAYNISYTLFYLCANYNFVNEKMIEYLLKKGANVNFIDASKGFDGLSILQTIILRGNQNIIALLLDRGADINYMVKDLSMNALMLAAKYIEDPIIIKLLLEHNANVHEINKDGYNALLFAAQYNPNPSIISLLVNYKAKIKPYTIKSALLKYNEVTPLMLAACYNNEEVVKKLIELGDNVDYKDSFDLGVLFMAAANNPSVDVIKTLISSGASLESAKDNEGNTPLMAAAYLNSNPGVIRYLIEKTHNLKTKNKDGLDFIDYLRQNNNLSEEEQTTILTKWL
jgi:ankyrin repeat protein